METKFSEEQRLNAVRLYQEGNSISKVVNLTGISSPYIKNLLRKYNISTRLSGFQKDNLSRTGMPHSLESKQKISKKHIASGHKPNAEAIAKGQPKTLHKRWGSHQKDPIGQFIRIYKAGAIRRNLEFSLTREEFESLIDRNCYYCGTSPSPRDINKSGSIICNGIDREDSNKGYYRGNCLPCCKICNVMKSNMSRDDFIEHCQKIGKRFVGAN